MDGFVFCPTKGEVIKSSRKGFDSPLKYSDLTNDSNGNKRNLYSLRHFYATQRLSEEVSPFLLARQMGGHQLKY
jgi:integrase